MTKIACLVAEGFEDSELQEPCDAFRKAGFVVEMVGAEAGQELHGYRGKVRVRTEKSLGQVSADDYDVLFIPGGHSPDRLRADPRAVALVSAFDQGFKPVLAICHGPQLLMAARRLEGRTLTAWKTVQRDLQMVPSVHVLDEPVVHDRNWITSRQPSDLGQFIEASLNYLHTK